MFYCSICILNIGGISNITVIKDQDKTDSIYSKDIGPGLIDNWVRKNSSEKFDKDGKFANAGSCNDIIFEQAQTFQTILMDKNYLTM